MVVTLNGERRELAGATTVGALLAELGYESDFVAVAVNETIVRRSNWPSSAVADGDRIEIVTPRQGG